MRDIFTNSGRQRRSGLAWISPSKLFLLCFAGLALGHVAHAQESSVQNTVDLKPSSGFLLPIAEERDLQDLERFDRSIYDRDWAGAFRLMTEMGKTQVFELAPVRDTSLWAPISVQIKNRIRSLEPEGLRNYRLFFDSQAKEALDAIRQHPNQGSFEQLSDLQVLLDVYWSTSIGNVASELAGDLYFNQGFFRLAEQSWQRAIEHDLTPTATIPALQVRRAIALQRLGDVVSIQAIYEGLAGRYDRLPVQLGGEEIDAIGLLKSFIDSDPSKTERSSLAMGDEGSSLALPAAGGKVICHLPFFTEEDRDDRMIAGPDTFGDLDDYVPKAVIDAEKIYFNWIETTFAVDRLTGKVRWINGDLRRDISQIHKRNTSTSGNPRNYNIALADDVLLTTRPVSPHEGAVPRFEIAAINPRNGETLWQSGSRADWQLELNTGEILPMSVIGEVCFHRGAAYVVVHEPLTDAPDKYVVCYLCRFDPNTGEITWATFLGTCRPLVFYYRDRDFFQRMPQPKLLSNNELLHVLIGEGKLITVNTSSTVIEWALHMDIPYDLQGNDITPRSENQLRWYYSDYANLNGSDSLLLHNGLLYAKQHMGRDLFALEPVSGELKLAVQGLPFADKVVAVDDEHFYTMNRVLTCYKKVDGEPQRVWDSRESSSLPRHSGVIYDAGRLLALDGSRLKVMNTKSGEVTAAFEDKTHLDPAGGYVYRFDDLIVCVGESSITAYRLP